MYTLEVIWGEPVSATESRLTEVRKGELKRKMVPSQYIKVTKRIVTVPGVSPIDIKSKSRPHCDQISLT